MLSKAHQANPKKLKKINMKNDYNELTGEIIKAAFNVHNLLGAGFLEKVYHNAMLIELNEMGINVASQYPANVFYKGYQVGDYYADLMVENCILVEIKAIEHLMPVHEIQLVNYLNATKTDHGLLINFGTSVTVKHKYRIYQKQSNKGKALH
jgi:GxxExxY protein